MKTKLSRSKLFRFFNRLMFGMNPGNMSKSEKKKVVVETDLRWEDDGGPVLESSNSNDNLNPDLVRDVKEK